MKQIKKIFTFLITGSFTLILAACYGAPVEYGYTKTIKGTDENDKPIEGLKLTLLKNDEIVESKISDNTGTVDFFDVKNNSYSYKVKIEDIDNEQNGVYKDSTIFLYSTDAFYDVKLK